MFIEGIIEINYINMFYHQSKKILGEVDLKCTAKLLDVVIKKILWLEPTSQDQTWVRFCLNDIAIDRLLLKGKELVFHERGH